MSQVGTMKLTGSTNIYYSSDMVACTIKFNSKENFMRAFKWWMYCSHKIKSYLTNSVLS